MSFEKVAYFLQGISIARLYDEKLSLCKSLFSRHLPNHASREVLIIFGCLTTCDPGDINDSIAVITNFES